MTRGYTGRLLKNEIACLSAVELCNSTDTLIKTLELERTAAVPTIKDGRRNTAVSGETTIFQKKILLLLQEIKKMIPKLNYLLAAAGVMYADGAIRHRNRKLSASNTPILPSQKEA